MANGKAHDRFNLYIGAFLSFALYFEIFIPCPTKGLLGFVIGWFVATFIFSPDTDLRPKDRTLFLKYLLFPYALLFKHRGISHSFFWGTLSRLLYTLVMGGIIIFVIHRMGYISFGVMNYYDFLISFVKNYDYGKEVYQFVTWLWIGHVLADGAHIFLDHTSSFLKRTRRRWRLR